MTFKKYKKWILEDPRSEKLNFEPDGRNHYAYRVSKDRNNHYYGSRTDRDNKTLGKGYFTSSRNLEFKNEFKANPEDYKVKIIRKFNNPGDKILFESYLHQKFDVKNHDSFINQSNQTAFGFDTTGKQLGSDHSRARPIFKLNLQDGKIIEEFETIAQAQKSIARGNVGDGLRKNKAAGGYAWCYKEDYNEKLVKEITKRDYKYVGSIYQLDKNTGEFIKKFYNVAQAMKDIGPYNFWGAINEVSFSAGGYAWCKPEDYSKRRLSIIERNKNEKEEQ